MATYGITQDWRTFLNQRQTTTGKSGTGFMEPARLAELKDLRARAYDTEAANVQKESIDNTKNYQNASLDLQRQNSLMDFMQRQAGLDASDRSSKISAAIQAPLALASAYKFATKDAPEAYQGLKSIGTKIYDYFNPASSAEMAVPDEWASWQLSNDLNSEIAVPDEWASWDYSNSEDALSGLWSGFGFDW